MPYNFNFDLTSISKTFFKEVAREAYEKGIHGKIGNIARNLVRKFRIDEVTGLNLSEAITLVEDLIDIFIANLLNREQFMKTRKRVLFLPHCARKYMDSRCKALFISEIPTYRCAHCTPSCLINQAVTLAERRGYDVYILPGGSCVPKILRRASYEGVIGVACAEELKAGLRYVKEMRLAGQGIPLVKNGCANTVFDLKTLESIL
ncbi:MAG: hypothetical protein DRJ31_05795 [Candidatus Methanomethylicota archaeon]|uniref:DUF116 domain-containing protein n=1 Tax=Thermoproteota archaeon TaxID=2056631 RepID=A0A497EPN4_9CREN|nr:MAG: hypothetical protein DRJ31_05795 [Candidatus Verstraetearchaeota archaeon]